VDVIWHDHVAADRNVEFVSAAKSVRPKRFVREIERLNPRTMESAKGNEKQWGIVGLKDLFQPWGAAFDHSKW